MILTDSLTKIIYYVNQSIAYRLNKEALYTLNISLLSIPMLHLTSKIDFYNILQ